MDDCINILVCDDSALMRKFLTETLSKNVNLKVVATAMNGRFALEKMQRLDLDLIFLDLEMPEMNGIEFLKEKKKLNNDIPVIIFSSIARAGASITMEALKYGASDYVLKKDIQILSESRISQETHSILVKYALSYGYKYKYQKTNDRSFLLKSTNEVEEKIEEKVEVVAVEKPVKRVAHRNPKVVAIGISTGGPRALREILPVFPRDFPLPILIVQHMPKNFTFEFAESLNLICKLKVKEAEDKELIKQGFIYIAKGDVHLRVAKNGLEQPFISFLESLPENGHKPSVDILFESTLKIYGSNQIAVIMTGMGKDGAREIKNIYDAGGYTIAQDQETSIVFGMPGVAVKYGAAEEILPLNKIPLKIIDIVKKYSASPL